VFFPGGGRKLKQNLEGGVRCKSLGTSVLEAYFYRYPASRGISRAVPKVSESSTGGAARIDHLTGRPRLVFCRQPLWCVSSAVLPFTVVSNGRIDLSAHSIPQACRINELLLYCKSRSCTDLWTSGSETQV
jgi:hypothetical protein